MKRYAPLIALANPDNDDITVHIDGGLMDYATPCGIATDGDINSGRQVPLPKNAKINCVSCRILFAIMTKYQNSDFED